MMEVGLMKTSDFNLYSNPYAFGHPTATGSSGWDALYVRRCGALAGSLAPLNDLLKRGKPLSILGTRPPQKESLDISDSICAYLRGHNS